MPSDTQRLLDSVDRLVRKGAASLAESTYWYWPSSGDNELGERNISFHVAKEIAEAGYLLYFEVPFPDRTREHIDFLGLNIEDGVLLLGESKRLYSTEKAQEMADDFHRLEGFQLSDKVAQPPEVAQRVAVLLATTWDTEIAKWWSSPTHAEPPAGSRATGWTALGAILDRGGASRYAGEVPLSWLVPSGEEKLHHALYALVVL